MKTKKQLMTMLVCIPLIFVCVASVGQLAGIPTVATSTGDSGSIRFVNGDSFSLTFEVNLKQIPEKGCYLKIADQAGEVLFEKRISSPEYVQTYRIERGNLSKITFEAKGKNFRFQESFNLQFRTEEKIEVTRL